MSALSTTQHPPVQNLVAPAADVALGIVAGGDELVSKGLQGRNLLLLPANKGVRPRWAEGSSPAWTAGLVKGVVILGGWGLAGGGIRIH